MLNLKGGRVTNSQTKSVEEELFMLVNVNHSWRK